MRTPKRLMNGLSIMIYRLREKGIKLNQIAFETGLNDHSDVIYHLKRYNDMITINPKFKRDEKAFQMDDFKEQYSNFRLTKSKGQRERLSVGNFNSSGIPKTKK